MANEIHTSVRDKMKSDKQSGNFKSLDYYQQHFRTDFQSRFRMERTSSNQRTIVDKKIKRRYFAQLKKIIYDMYNSVKSN